MSLKEMQEGKLGAYIPLFFFRYRGQEREIAGMDMTKEQKIELCKIYTNSDIKSSEYMMQFCDGYRVYFVRGYCIPQWYFEGIGFIVKLRSLCYYE